MKQSIGFNQFCDAFVNMNRNDQFSYPGKRALYDWLDALEEAGVSGEYELDVIALCCEFTEYEDLAEFQGNYGADQFPTLDSISDHTSLIMIDDESFIISDF